MEDNIKIETVNWVHRSSNMLCRTCMYYVPKVIKALQENENGNNFLLEERGHCRINAPTMKGFPVVFPTDWCGEHKLTQKIRGLGKLLSYTKKSPVCGG